MELDNTLRVTRLTIAALLTDSDEDGAAAMVASVFDEVNAAAQPDVAYQSLLITAVAMHAESVKRLCGGTDGAIEFLRTGIVAASDDVPPERT